jgi:hypothetical protein
MKMTRFEQFMQEREGMFERDNGLAAILQMAAEYHKEEVLSFLDELSTQDSRLRAKIAEYKEKAGRRDDNLPSNKHNSEFDEIIPSSADGGGGASQEDDN